MSSAHPVFDGPLGPTVFEIVRGSPSAEELAAVTALLTALAAAREVSEPPVRGAGWPRPELCPPASWMAGGRPRVR
ncbi:acyl-CoA carboxylase epsilon subunit [Streptomyces sp. NPDC093260]|uniref:acyl-CoA carboxylase epsilon subunit n=1 Tax=Streptomyces sp. NPDC093260 TaxID=3155073 RepID=UPI003419EE18